MTFARGLRLWLLIAAVGIHSTLCFEFTGTKLQFTHHSRPTPRTLRHAPSGHRKSNAGITRANIAPESANQKLLPRPNALDYRLAEPITESITVELDGAAIDAAGPGEAVLSAPFRLAGHDWQVQSTNAVQSRP